MAKKYYNISTSTNFNFGKILKTLKPEEKKAKVGLIKSATELTKKNITSRNLRPLSPSTINKRKPGSSHKEWIHSAKITNDTTPLKYSGQLLESIKAIDSGIEMEGYGKEHHEGFTNPDGNFIEKRPFIAGLEGVNRQSLEKESKKISGEFAKKINNIMKK